MNSINEIEAFLGLSKTAIHNDFFCVLTGQFSSGKSKFMNRLFGAEYLPVGTREMTAAPTYIKRGEDSALVYRNEEYGRVPISEIKDIKKGKCDYDKIELTLSCLNTPENMIFIDTPGINSVSFEKCDDELRKADAVFYFLAKSISAIDVEMIENICSPKEIKLIIVRTRIDDIKGSEESIYETYAEEKALIKSIYPDAVFFFVSLHSDDCNQNQISDLMGYVKYDLLKELERQRKEYMHTYIEETLRPALNKMKTEIEISANETLPDNLIKKTQKQLKIIKKNVNACEDRIRSQMDTAKKNYYRSGCIFIDKCIAGKGDISCMEIQTYILKSIRKLEAWYELELEDIVADISGAGKSSGAQKLVSDEVISQIFSKYEKNRTRFAEFSIIEQECNEKMNQYCDAVMAKAYLKKLFNSIFIRIDVDLSKSYSEKIELIIDELNDRYTKEDELIHKYASNEAENLNKINEYLLELNDYGIESEIA